MALRARWMLVAGFATLVATDGRGARERVPSPGKDVRAAVRGRLPLRFEENVGQFEPKVRYLARRGGAMLFLTNDSATLRLRAAPPGGRARPVLPHEREPEPANEPDAVVTLKVAGGREVTPRADRECSTRTSYFIGDDPSKWRTHVRNFGSVTYPGVLEGVDLVYRGGGPGESELEYDFVVAPLAEVGAIALEVSGVSGLSLTAAGDLVMRVEGGELVQRRPRVFQRDASGVEHDVAGAYRLVDEGRVGFAVASYDPARELVIDPMLSYSTYLGGTGGESGEAIAADAAGNAYVTGRTPSADFPTQAPLQAARAGGNDAFVSKLNAAGTALVYATYIGGAASETGYGVAVDGAGNAYVAGDTTSTDFPTLGPAQATNGSIAGGSDAFVIKLNAAGSGLVYATYFGGFTSERAAAIAVDPSGHAYVAGYTGGNLPTRSAFQPTFGGGSNDGYVVKVSPTGSTFLYATYLGGNSYDEVAGIAADSAGNAYVTGRTASVTFPIQNPFQATNRNSEFQVRYDGFVTKLNAAGSALVYSTYLGGIGYDFPEAIAVDAAGSAYVAGETLSSDFPIQGAIQTAKASSSYDGFLTKLAPAGNTLVYSTYLGGLRDERFMGVAVDADGNALVAGDTSSVDFPTRNPIQAAFGGGPGDALVTKVNATGTALVYSTYLGLASWEGALGLALDGEGNALISGFAEGAFPTQGPFQAVNAGATDAFIAKVSAPALGISPARVSVSPLGSQAFVASGGSGAGYAFALRTNASGGSIDVASGAYVAGPTPDVTDAVTVTDSDGTIATASVTVTTVRPDASAPDAGDAAAPPDGGPGGDASPPAKDAAATTPDASPCVSPCTADELRGDGSVVPASGGSAAGCTCDATGRRGARSEGLVLLTVASTMAFARRRRRG